MYFLFLKNKNPIIFTILVSLIFLITFYTLLQPKTFHKSKLQIENSENKPTKKKIFIKRIKKGSKEWKEAIKRIKSKKGKGNNHTVNTEKEARELLAEAKPNLKEYPLYTKKQYKSGFEVHPAEPIVGNDLPHIKWKDWSSGKSEVSDGHIFFTEGTKQ